MKLQRCLSGFGEDGEGGKPCQDDGDVLQETLAGPTYLMKLVIALLDIRRPKNFRQRNQMACHQIRRNMFSLTPLFLSFYISIYLDCWGDFDQW
jgi:hypothetical protein